MPWDTARDRRYPRRGPPFRGRSTTPFPTAEGCPGPRCASRVDRSARSSCPLSTDAPVRPPAASATSKPASPPPVPKGVLLRLGPDALEVSKGYVQSGNYGNVSYETAVQGGRGGWHKASVSDCVPLAAPIGPSPLLILTLCGPERVLVVSTEPLDDLSCLTTPGVGCPGDGAVARAVDQGHPEAHFESTPDLPTPALTCACWGVHLQDHVPEWGF